MIEPNKNLLANGWYMRSAENFDDGSALAVYCKDYSYWDESDDKYTCTAFIEVASDGNYAINFDIIAVKRYPFFPMLSFNKEEWLGFNQVLNSLKYHE